MPAYPGNNLAKLLHNNGQGFLWDNEIVSVGTLSKAYILERINRSYYPWGLSLEVTFSGAPGTFEIDLMGANSDIGYPSPGSYIKLGSITTVNGSNVGRYDMASNLWPKYVAGYIASLANAVNVTLTVTK